MAKSLDSQASYENETTYHDLIASDYKLEDNIFRNIEGEQEKAEIERERYKKESLEKLYCRKCFHSFYDIYEFKFKTIGTFCYYRCLMCNHIASALMLVNRDLNKKESDKVCCVCKGQINLGEFWQGRYKKTCSQTCKKVRIKLINYKRYKHEV